MTPTLEIIAQIFWVILALGLIYKAYSANKRSKRSSLKSLLNADAEEAAEGFPVMFIAIGFVSGVTLLILLANKLATCGLTCGTLLP